MTVFSSVVMREPQAAVVMVETLVVWTVDGSAELWVTRLAGLWVVWWAVLWAVWKASQMVVRTVCWLAGCSDPRWAVNKELHLALMKAA